MDNRDRQTPLSRIFAKTDKISFGIFSITKSPRDSWNAARFHLGEAEIRITPQQKQLMALLIAQQGELLPPALVAREVGSLNASLPLSSVRDKIKKQVAAIRKAIRNSEAALAYPDAPDRIVAHRSPVQAYGSEMASRYRLEDAGPKHNI